MAESDYKDTVLHCPVCRSRHLPVSGSLKDGVYVCTCQNCGHFFKFRASGPVRSQVTFTVNGKSYTVGNEFVAAVSLNDFLRTKGVSFGTKVMCIEGGCGVCLVAAKLYDPISNTKKTYAVNSCLCQLYACDGWEITTIEGLGNPRDGLHPIQDRLAQYNGSQCGFCSPAQVMNMYGLLKEVPKPTMMQVEDTFDTTICRCTGYRPILDAMKSFATDAPRSLPGGPIDIEELDRKICSKTGAACTGVCSRPKPDVPLHMVLSDAQWFRPTTKQQLYSLLAQYKTQNYRLVFGNTGFGVYKEIGPWMYDILIDIRGVQEFYPISFNTTVNFGASLTLTNMLDIFRNHLSDPGLGYFQTFAAHLARVANTGVRNLGTWSGNLMLKHLHPEFPSDIFIMLETVGTQLVIGDSNGGHEVQYSIMDFLKLDMTGKAIVSAVLPKFSSVDVYVRTFKIMPRAQNAHAYVNAGFRMDLDRKNNFTVKTKPSIVINGISKTFNHATQTEAYLVGKQLGDASVLKGAISTLSGELVPDTTAGLSSTAYRKCLAEALFYKYVLGVCGSKAAARFQSGSTNLLRPLSSGKQTYDTHRPEWPLTEPITKLTATLQTSGVAQFVNDVPAQPGELAAAFVISNVGNAKIQNVDPSQALKYPGVLKYISASDIPPGGINNWMQGAGDTVVEEVFCSGQIRYCGQPIGVVVAVDQTTADTGASMVKVTYTDVQPPILTMEDAIQKQSIFPDVAKEMIVGDAESAIAGSAHKITGSISMGTQYHFQLETQISICTPTEDGKGMSIIASSQWIDRVETNVAGFLNIPESSVNVEVRRLGGAFGSKISRNFLISNACSLAAYVMRRPVRLMMNFHTNMKTIGKRFPYLAKYQAGFTDAGKLNGLKITCYGDCGASPNDSSLSAMAGWIDNAYYCENWKCTPVALKTNHPSPTYCRSPGSCPATFIMESIMEHVAKSLNKDQLEVRKLNLYHKGQKTPVGMVLNYCSLPSLVAQLETSADVQTRKQQISTFNQANRWKKKGISVVPLKFGIGWSGGMFNVFVTIYNNDGSVAIAHGGVECGQGINTKTAQVCAYELGVPLDQVRVKKNTTLTNANSVTTGGSITSELACMGVIECCKQLKIRMAPVKAKLVNPTWKQLVHACYGQGVDLTARFFTDPYDQYFWEYNSYGVTCTEVTLDVLTGENQINRVDMLYDCGESMNPEIDIGQAEGAFVMGLGYWLTEKTIYNPKTGENLTDGTWEYKPPLSKDIPIDFRVQFLKNAPNPVGVLRSKAVGEPPLCMASSALFAVKHAIEAARKEISQDTFFPLNGPATVEEVQINCLVAPLQFSYGT